MYACPTTRASGSIPRVLTNSSEQTTTQEAPSVTPGALPAVVVPSGSNTGGRAASFSSVVSRRMLSSAATLADRDDLVLEAAGVLRGSRALVRAGAHASWSSREIPSSRETADACWIMWRPSKVEVRPSNTMWSNTSP